MQDNDVIVEIIREELLTRKPTYSKQLKAWGKPSQATVRIICAQQALQGIETHAQGSMDREVGGILVGDAYQYKGCTYIEVQAYIPAENQQQSGRTHFRFTPETWAEMLQTKDQRFDDLKTVGWFHSHPGHGIFLSPGMDTEIQEKHFAQPWQTAMVFDPKKNEVGFFIWQGSRIQMAPGFYELYDEQSQGSIVQWRYASKPKARKAPPPPKVKRDWVSLSSLIIASVILIISLFSMAIILRMYTSDFEETTSSQLEYIATSSATEAEALQTQMKHMAQTQAEQATAIAELQTQNAMLQGLLAPIATPTPLPTPIPPEPQQAESSLPPESQPVASSMPAITITVTAPVSITAPGGAITKTRDADAFEVLSGTTFTVCTSFVVSTTEEITGSLWMSFSHSVEITNQIRSELVTLTFTPSEPPERLCFSPREPLRALGVWTGDVYIREGQGMKRKVSFKEDATVKINITE